MRIYTYNTYITTYIYSRQESVQELYDLILIGGSLYLARDFGKVNLPWEITSQNEVIYCEFHVVAKWWW